MIFTFTCKCGTANAREIRRGIYACEDCGAEVRRDVVAEQRNAARKAAGIGGAK
jgi:ribosomal protein L37AE/L43A